MAVSVTSAVLSPDGILTIRGSEFTKTTTTVTVDDEIVAFELVSAEELTVLDVDPDTASDVKVEKNGYSAEAEITDEDDETVEPVETPTEEGSEPQSSTPQSGEGTETGQYQPATIDTSGGGSGSSPATSSGTNEGEPIDPTLHGGGAQHGIAGSGGNEVFTTYAGDQVYKAFIPAGMEAAPQAIAPGTWPSPIDGFRAAVAGQQLTGLIPIGDEKTPYPTGASLAPGKRFWQQQGYYKSATPT